MNDLQNLHQFLPSTKFELVTDTASVVAIASPWWLPYLKEVSEVAALMLPIAGVIWLATQIGWKWYRELKTKR